MNILVLDLSPLARRLIREELLVSGYEVIEAESPGQALDILTRVRDISPMTTAVSLGRNHVDLVLTDLNVIHLQRKKLLGTLKEIADSRVGSGAG